VARLLGLDIGTTSAKAVVFTEHGQVVSEGRAPTPWMTTATGVELAPRDLLAASCQALNEAVAADANLEPITAVGITSMGESGVLVDRAGDPVAPVIAWHDGRDSAEVDALRRELGENLFCATTGKPLRGQFSLTKHRWLMRHDQERASAAVRRFNVAEYVANMLGGEEACELSLASRTGWFDIAKQAWWPDGLDFSGASPTLMPPLVMAGDPVGAIGSELVDRRLHGAVLTLAGHDHQAAAVGAGATTLGAELDSCGTAEALLRTVPPTLSGIEIMTLAKNGVTTDWSIQRGSWSLLAATEGGLAMQRTLAMLGVDREGLAALDRQAIEVTPSGIQVNGIGSDALSVSGIRDDATPGAIWRAVVAAATAQAHALHRAMAEVAGPPQDLVVTGGWSHSEAVLAAKKETFGAFRLAEAYEAGARGAAIYAGRAAKVLEPDETFQSA
jgi:sugar (pentulose or hexulose) kinase